LQNIIEIPVLNLILAYIFVLITILIARFFKLSIEKEIIIATIRMTVQLYIVGYILKYIFDTKSIILAVLMLCIMETFAVYNALSRAKVKMQITLKFITAIALVGGSLITLFVFLTVIIGIRTFDARYIITISGMVIGNSMTAVSISARSLCNGMVRDRAKVEAALMLGATPRQACMHIIREAFTLSAMPNINSMMGMGIVSLPGMMTGQILAGMSPLIATRYQIAILLGICGSVTLCCAVFLVLGYKTFFSNRAQLI
jgi:putative ABC transport system permease protein